MCAINYGHWLECELYLFLFLCAHSSLKYHFYAFAKSTITATTGNMPCQTTLTESRQHRMSGAVHTGHVHVFKTAGWSPAEQKVQSWTTFNFSQHFKDKLEMLKNPDLTWIWLISIGVLCNSIEIWIWQPYLLYAVKLLKRFLLFLKHCLHIKRSTSFPVRQAFNHMLKQVHMRAPLLSLANLAAQGFRK